MSPPVDLRKAAAREAAAVADRYGRRPSIDWRYDRRNPAALLPGQERERALAALLHRRLPAGLGERSLVEVGCGHGDNLLELLRLGFAPSRLQGVELLPERMAVARERLPVAVHLHLGDAIDAPVEPASQDLVLQSLVFSSLLDDAVQQRLADAMWHWLRPGGAVLWYDFTVDNPRNADVRGVPLARVRRLFPEAAIDARRLTLAPPIARRAVALHPALYPLLAALPPLRTHLLAWIGKPAG